MGMDVCSESGVVVNIEDITNLLDDDNLERIKAACETFFHTMIIDKESNYLTDLSPQIFFKKLSHLKELNLKQMKKLLSELVQIEGSPSKYDISTNVVHSEILVDLFQIVLKQINNKLPDLIDVTAFGSSRYNGYEVPLGVACFIFDKTKCYEQVLTPSGQTMVDTFGHCKVIEWTTVSY